MIKSISIENFRSFEKLQARDLRRINVIVGQNASGKTAFLEAVKLGLDARPQTLPWLNNIRGLPLFVLPNATNEQFQAAFLDFFHDFDPQKTISTELTDFDGRTATLKISFDPSSATTIQPTVGFRVPSASGALVPSIDSSTVNTISPLAFERVDFAGQKSKLFASLNQNGLQLGEGTSIGPVSGFFSSIAVGAPHENATWFSRLRVEKRSDEVVSALSRHFDFIRELSTETSPIGLPMVYADIESIPQKIPLSLVSAGVHRLFTFILAVVTYKGGVVLIDEIEDGIYFKQYPATWKTLYDLATHHDTQLFVSSHSDECLKGLQPIMEGRPEDFMLLRLSKDGANSVVHQVNGKFFEAALDGADLR